MGSSQVPCGMPYLHCRLLYLFIFFSALSGCGVYLIVWGRKTFFHVWLPPENTDIWHPFIHCVAFPFHPVQASETSSPRAPCLPPFRPPVSPPPHFLPAHCVAAAQGTCKPLLLQPEPQQRVTQSPPPYGLPGNEVVVPGPAVKLN